MKQNDTKNKLFYNKEFHLNKLIEELFILERKMAIAKIEKRKLKYLWHKLKYKIKERKYYNNGGI